MAGRQLLSGRAPDPRNPRLSAAGLYRQFPKLACGPFAGYPRVFGIAWAFVAHTDSYFDLEMLCRFVTAYQEVQPLTIGELWAVAITLQDRAGREPAAARGTRAQQRGAAAGRQAGRPAAGRGRTRRRAGGRRARDARRQAAGEPFAVQLVHRLRDQDPRVTPALLWLDQQLAAHGSTADTAVREEHQRQGPATVTVRNIITSMRMISDVDWPGWSSASAWWTACCPPARRSATMDFPTRDLYRRAIEELARGARLTELDVAREAGARGETAARQG